MYIDNYCRVFSKKKFQIFQCQAFVFEISNKMIDRVQRKTAHHHSNVLLNQS